MFPRGDGAAMDAVFLNTAGGLTGGDQFRLETSVASGATLRVTTQAAERAYRAQACDPSAVMQVNHRVSSGATLMSLPQETILFDGAALDRTTRYDLAPDARLLACELLVFGRAAMGETVSHIRLSDRIDLWRDGRLVYADRLRLTGNAVQQLASAAVAGGAGAVATVVLAGQDVGDRVPALRGLLPDGIACGISSPVPGVVTGRFAAPDSFALRAFLVPLLQFAAGGVLPRPWML